MVGVGGWEGEEIKGMGYEVKWMMVEKWEGKG